jgi:hypothetical protein
MRNTGIFLLILHLVVNVMAYPFINIALIAIFGHRFLQLSLILKVEGGLYGLLFDAGIVYARGQRGFD